MSESQGPKQIPFNLAPAKPYSLKYLVPHSGIAPVALALQEAVERALQDEEFFAAIYVYGPAGTGKTHLVRAFEEHAIERGLPEDRVRVYEIDRDVDERYQDESWASPIIADYERLKSYGGLLFLSAPSDPNTCTINPHVRSRLLAGAVLEVSYPREEELRPVIDSLLERHSMKLSDYSLDYLLKRLPHEPLSFDNIFARISRFSLTEAKPAGMGVIRKIMQSNPEKNG